MILPAPAKLNLFLHIVGRRQDGYHELQTAFQFLEFGDTVRFQRREDTDIRLYTTSDIPPEKNLAWRAAKHLQQYTHIPLGADIYLEKQIPIGAGLGGGSSNAATTLLALNHLWETQLSLNTLAYIGQQLGADVPVFVRGKTSWAESIGERLTPIQYPEYWYVVLIPPCTISTSDIFQHPQLIRNTPRIEMEELRLCKKSNDFEPLIRMLYPSVAKALDWLNSVSQLYCSAGTARLTGSGSAIFAPFTEQSAAEQVFNQKPDWLQGVVTRSMNYSPLFSELDKIAG